MPDGPVAPVEPYVAVTPVDPRVLDLLQSTLLLVEKVIDTTPQKTKLAGDVEALQQEIDLARTGSPTV